MPWPTNRPPLDYIDERAPAMPYQEPERPFPAIGIPLSMAEPLQLGIAQAPQIPSYQLQEPTGVPQAQAPQLRGLPNLSMPGPEYNPSALPQMPPPDMSPEALARVMALGGMASPTTPAAQPAKTSAAVPYLPRLNQTEEGRRGREQAARTADALRGLARVLSFAVTHDAAADAASRAQPTESQLLRQTMEQERQQLRTENAQDEGAYNARQDRARGLEEHAQDRASSLAAAAAEAQRTAELRDPADPRNQSAQQQVASILGQFDMPSDEIQRIVSPLALGDEASIETVLATTGLYSANARSALDRAIRAMKVANRGGGGGAAPGGLSESASREVFRRLLIQQGHSEAEAAFIASPQTTPLADVLKTNQQVLAAGGRGAEGAFAREVAGTSARRADDNINAARDAMSELRLAAEAAGDDPDEAVSSALGAIGGVNVGGGLRGYVREGRGLAAQANVLQGTPRRNRYQSEFDRAVNSGQALQRTQLQDTGGKAVTGTEFELALQDFGTGTITSAQGYLDMLNRAQRGVPRPREGGMMMEYSPPMTSTQAPQRSAGAVRLTVRLVDADTGEPIPGMVRSGYTQQQADAVRPGPGQRKVVERE